MSAKSNLVQAAAVVLVFASAACDFSPSSPFEGFDDAQQQGARLNGRFEGLGATAASQQSVPSGYNAQRTAPASSSDALTATEVIVYAADGSEIASVDVDDDGSFTLRGLPESFTLVFVDASGNQVGAAMEFEGVRPNQEIDIVVAMVNGEVVLLEESRTGIDHDGIEIEGTASGIVIDSPPDLMTGSLDVNDYHILTRAAETSIRKGNRSLTLEDLDDGDRVHVRGVFEGDDVFAYEIKLQEEDEEDEEGQVTLCHIPPGNPGNAHTITVGASAVPAHLAHGDYLGACR